MSTKLELEAEVKKLTGAVEELTKNNDTLAAQRDDALGQLEALNLTLNEMDEKLAIAQQGDAQQANPNSSPPNFSSEVQSVATDADTLLAAACLGALKNWSTGGPIEARAFASMKEQFVSQAIELMQDVKSRLAAIE